jgi:hypothetical protein
VENQQILISNVHCPLFLPFPKEMVKMSKYELRAQGTLGRRAATITRNERRPNGRRNDNFTIKNDDLR